MSNVSTIADKRMRCPRCSARPAVQNAVELRPGIKYLTLRCISCRLVYNAQVQVEADPATVSRLMGRTDEPPRRNRRGNLGPMETQPRFDAGRLRRPRWDRHLLRGRRRQTGLASRPFRGARR